MTPLTPEARVRALAKDISLVYSVARRRSDRDADYRVMLSRLEAWEHEIYTIAVLLADATADTWRCFHCDEVFTDRAAAREHFGSEQHATPVCQVDGAEYRRMEEAFRRSAAEDTDLHREIRSLQAGHAAALRRAEEEGYARGLADATAERAEPQELEEVYQIRANEAHYMLELGDVIISKFGNRWRVQRWMRRHDGTVSYDLWNVPPEAPDTNGTTRVGSFPEWAAAIERNGVVIWRRP